MTTKHTLSAFAATLLLLTGAARTGHAYTTHGRWVDETPNMRVSAVSFPTGDSYRSALSTAFTRWNNNPSQFNWNVIWDEPSVGLLNLQNEVWATAGEASDPPAEAVVVYGLGVMSQADVVFYTDSDGIAEDGWTSFMTCSQLDSYGGSHRAFEPAAIHELGHALGLGHEDDEYNIMGDDWNHVHRNGSICRSYVGENASDGAVALYGLDSDARQDVSVSHWMYSGSDGEYSEHTLTRIYVAGTNTALPSAGLSDEQRRYSVNAGATVDVEFTYENNGRSTQSPSLRFYRSSDSNITTTDTYLASRSLTLARGHVYTTRIRVRIPSGTASGDYYLGAIVDPGDAISEFDESNNAASIPIRVN